MAMEFCAVEREGVHIFSYRPGDEMPSNPDISFPPVEKAEGCVWSSDGALLGLTSKSTGNVSVYDAAHDYQKLCEVQPLIKGAPVRAFYFSPLGNHLVTYEYWVKDGGDNVGLWDARTGELRWSFLLRTLTEMNWPPLKWTSQETHCCRMVSDGVQILNGNAARDAPLGKIAAPGIIAFEVAPKGTGSGPPHIAVVLPEAKGAPASCLIYSVDNVSTVRARKSFYKVEKVKLMWNNTGSSLLVLTSMETDDTGKAYYGSTNLYFVRADGEEDAIVASAGDGSVHDVAWCPTQDEFLLLHGDLPCPINLLDGKKAKQRMEFGTGRRNTIRWNQFGRFVAIGGFGQLAGDVDFWDRIGRNKLGSLRMDCCVMSGWAPDGRHFLAATTAPRMRMDNKIDIYDYCGNKLGGMPFQELLFAGWRPRPRGGFQDRPPSPERKGPSAGSGPKAVGGKPAAKQAYRPPGARSAGGGGLSALLRSELGSTSGEANSTASKVFGRAAHALPPGAAPPDESKDAGVASRNARRKKGKETAQAAEEAQKKAVLDAALRPVVAGVDFSPPSRKAEADALPAEGPDGNAAPMDPAEVEKKVRALRKKLRDIEKLKEKPAKDLDVLQKEKLKGEADLLKQLQELGAEE